MCFPCKYHMCQVLCVLSIISKIILQAYWTCRLSCNLEKGIAHCEWQVLMLAVVGIDDI
jgi:hypothetical protein